MDNLYLDFAAGNMEGLRAVLDETVCTVSEPFPYAGTFHGFEETFQGAFARIPHDWSGFVHEIFDVIETGDDVLATGCYYGNWLRTGRPIEAPFVHHFHFNNGQLIRFHQYVDRRKTLDATDGFMHEAATRDLVAE